MSPASIIQTKIELEKGSSALAQLIAATGLDETELIDAASKGAIWHQKPRGGKLKRIRNIDHSAALGMGHTLCVNYHAEVLAEEPLTPELVSDEKNYSIWYKPKGMWTQGSKWGDHCTITEVVRKRHDRPAHLVHRLDKATSGLMVIAHTKEATRRLTALFADRIVEKYYRATVPGQFKQTLPFVIDSPIDDKPAVTSVVTADFDKIATTSKLTVKIETGRKHQIRRHLSEAGFPVIGDRLYGNADENSPDLQLEAFRLAFTCPFTTAAQDFIWPN